jgi:hypothetical protein
MGAPMREDWKTEATVKKSVQLPADMGWLILLDPDRRVGGFHNLLRVDANGMEIWRAKPREDSRYDFFVDITVDGGELIAWAWSCYRLVIDPVTGETTHSEFAKATTNNKRVA